MGITTYSIEDRWRNHQKKSSKCILVKRAIDKYGWENLKKEILLECRNDELQEYEQKFIQVYDTVAPKGMNCTSGGELNKTLSTLTKTNISEAVKQFFQEHPEKHGSKGKKPSLETREKLSKANKRYTQSAAYKEHVREKYKHNKGCVVFRRGAYNAHIPGSWNNGKRYIGRFKTRELAQAAIDKFKQTLEAISVSTTVTQPHCL